MSTGSGSIQLGVEPKVIADLLNPHFLGLQPEPCRQSQSLTASAHEYTCSDGHDGSFECNIIHLVLHRSEMDVNPSQVCEGASKRHLPLTEL